MEELDFEDLFELGVIPGSAYNYITHMQAEIDELVDMLDLMHEAFSEDMFTEPRRELEELLAKHKQEKE